MRWGRVVKVLALVQGVRYPETYYLSSGKSLHVSEENCSTEGGADISSSSSGNESPARLCVDSANRYGPPQGGFVVSVITACIELCIKLFQRSMLGGG